MIRPRPLSTGGAGSQGQLNSPHVELLAKQEVVVEVSDGPVHSVAVAHLHHGGSGFTLHELHLAGEQNRVRQRLDRVRKLQRSFTDPLHVSIETEDVEDPVCVHLGRVEPVSHNDRRVGVGAVFAGRWRRRPVTRPVAPAAAPPHRGAHPTALIGRGPVALLVAMVTASYRTMRQENVMHQT